MPEHDVIPVLHNSGPGPIAIYKTGAVGTTHTLACAPVLEALQLRDVSRSALRSAVLSAKVSLEDRGLLLPFRGLATLDAAGPVRASIPSLAVAPVALPWLPGASPADTVRWALVAFAHVTPPMLLFTRSPDLAGCTARQLLRLQWFGSETHR